MDKLKRKSLKAKANALGIEQLSKGIFDKHLSSNPSICASDRAMSLVNLKIHVNEG